MRERRSAKRPLIVLQSHYKPISEINRRRPFGSSRYIRRAKPCPNPRRFCNEWIVWSSGCRTGGSHGFVGRRVRRGGADRIVANVAGRGGTIGRDRGGYRGGAGVGLGIAGALIGGAIIGATQPDGYYGYPPDYYGPAYVAAPPHVGGDAVAYCQQRFQSSDPYSGTYLGFDGLRHPYP